jgi:cystathionine beta-lyase/cystathionine gamma-synthase
MNQELVEKQTRKDLCDDFDELLFLAFDSFKKITVFNQASPLKCKEGDALTQRLKTMVQALKHLRSRIDTESVTELLEQKHTFCVEIRTCIAEVAGMVTSLNWQSPTFKHSVSAEAGLLTGSITGNITDYTRDQLITGNEYQRWFGNEIVTSWRMIPIQVLLTQSGMAALTTILMFLLRKKQFTRPILLGKNSYFQNKELISYLTPQPVIEVDEHDTASVIEAIQTYKPSVLFFDTVCNSPTLATPDLRTIVKHLFLEAETETYLVIDNTLASLGFEPLSLLYPFRGKVKLICFESMNKYYQYGMDRTIGGFVWGLPQDASKLFYARLHAGTIMTDVSTAMLPTPNKKRLMKRLQRMERNALWLANSLQTAHLPLLTKIYHPKLSSHPAYAWARTYHFSGSSVTLEFDTKQRKSAFYHKRLDRFIQLAKKRNISLNAGSSFGLTTTRVYVTALNAEMGQPFLRISLGTETATEMQPLTQLFIDGLT